MIRALADYIYRCYAPQEFPALSAQISLWQKTMPLQGLHILDATPVFRNTLVKYYALLVSGAKLTVSVGREIPCDPRIIAMLPDFGIDVADTAAYKKSYDLIADCAGRHAHMTSKSGFVELTRSGLEYYRGFLPPVYSADSGMLKVIETSLGTADGFIRAMTKLGYGEFSGKKILIFGGGKVGGGMALSLKKYGAEITVADCNASLRPPAGCHFIHTGNKEKMRNAIYHAWCIIAATGLTDALEDFAEELNSCSAKIVNMGVEDEFSPLLPSKRVLNEKRPLNFILDEPTRLCFIDPVMALNNALLCKLAHSGNSFCGIALPPEDTEAEILQQVIAAGLIPADLIKSVIGNRKELKI